MNERIQELKEQAFDAVWDLDKTTTGPSTHFIPDGFEQKFAELIVKDCCDVLIKWKHEPFPFDESVAVSLIREHFGVEQ